MSSHDTTIVDSRSNGVVAVICEDDRFLVIKRASQVIAPGKLCFPGGAVQPGEADEEAVEREVREELGVGCRVGERIWASLTPWQVPLTWWWVWRDVTQRWKPRAKEVAWVGWLSAAELLAEEHLLESNRDFLVAVEEGEVLFPPAG